MAALGDEADIAVDRINAEPVFADRLAAYARNGGIEPSTSQKQARAIMGKNFFGIEEAVKHLGINPSKHQLACLAEIPWSKGILTTCKDTHILAAIFPLSILDLRDKVANKCLFHKEEWYNKQPFAQDAGEIAWHLVRKTRVTDSLGKNWTQQQALLSHDQETPRAQVMVYTIIGHFLATGERLFEKVYVRCSDRVSEGYRVDVGKFDTDGLYVNNNWDDGASDNLGLPSSRKSEP